VISKVLASPKLLRPPLPESSKSNLKNFVIGDEKVTSKSATVDKPKSGTTVEKSASKETDAAPEEPKSTTALADSPTKPKKAKFTTALAYPPKQPAAVKSDYKLEQQ